MEWTLGIWDRRGELCPTEGPSGMVIRHGRHPAQLSGGVLDLLAVSPGAVGWAGAGVIRCRTALLPGSAAPLARAIAAEQAVSYGTGSKDTITLSGLDGGRMAAAVQRALITLDGTVIEPQELVLPCPADISPALFLARVGMALLLGADPARLSP